MKRWLVVFLVGFACGKSDSAARRSTAPPEDARGAAVGDAIAHAPVEAPVAVPAPTGPYKGPDCRQTYAPRPDRDDAPMCFQPGGVFLMGSPEGEGGPAEHPQRRVTLSPFFIDQFEVTRAQFARFLNEAPHGLGCDGIGPGLCPEWPAGRWPWVLDIIQGGKPHDWNKSFTNEKLSFAVRAGEERIAMDDVTIAAARGYCAWVGKVLPTNARWEYAARVEPLTGKLRRYPWGDRFESTLANCDLVECGGSGVVKSVDAFPRDMSATGVRGLAGNVSERVEGCATLAIPECGDCVDPVEPTSCPPRLFTIDMGGGEVVETLEWVMGYRGGGAISTPDETRGAWRDPEGAPRAYSRIGFRCTTNAITAPAVRSRPSL